MNSSECFVHWRKSSYSSNDQGECLEVADGYTNIPVRDSKNPTGPTLLFQATGWTAFIAALKAEGSTG